MKTIKLTIALLIAILFVLPGAGFAQQIDKKSEDAKKAESGISAQEKETQEQTDQSTFSTKDNDEKKEKEDQKTVKQTKKKKSKEGDPQFGTEDKTREQPPAKEVEEGTIEKEKGTGYHTLKEEQQATESISGAAAGDTKEKAPPKETPPAKETPPGKVKEKEPTSRGASDYAPGHVKKKDVEEAKEKAHISVKNTENAVLSTEQRIAVAKEKIEDVRLRLDEKMKAGTITEQEYHEKMVRISQAEERLISLELEMNADKEKVNQTKKFIDQPAQK